MNRAARSAALLSSLMVSLLFLAGSVGIPGGIHSGWPSRKGDASARFHGKSAGRVGTDPSCQSGKCHPPSPHERGGTLAAFLNFHGEFADCLVCHGKSAEGIRVEKKEPAGRVALRSGNPAPSQNPHEGTASPTPCRGCHSEAGKNLLRSRGLEEFPNGFDNPMALRMIEERKDRWLPAGLR